jgi:hypothetical protein
LVGKTAEVFTPENLQKAFGGKLVGFWVKSFSYKKQDFLVKIKNIQANIVLSYQ